MIIQNRSLMALLAFCLAVGLSACGKDEDKSSGGSGNGGNSAPQATGNANDHWSYTELSYEIESVDPATGETCTTGRHTYESMADLCRAFRDRALNNGCAENERQSAYTADCTQFGPWTPIVEQTQPANPQQPELPPQPRQPEFRFRELHVFFHNAERVDTSHLPRGYSASVTESALQELSECDVVPNAYINKGCFDSEFITHDIDGAQLIGAGKWARFLFLDHSQSNASYIVLIEYRHENDLFKAVKGYLYTSGDGLTENSTVSDFANAVNSSRLSQLASFTAYSANPDSDKTVLLNLAAQATTLRPLYHRLNALTYTRPSESEFTRAASIATEKKNLLLSSRSALYQNKMYKLIETTLPVSTQDRIAIARALFNSSHDSTLKRETAIFLANNSIRTEAIHSAIVSAMGESSSYDRLRALRGLIQIQNGLADQTLILGRFTDHSYDVQSTAIQAASAMTITEAHMPKLQELFRNTSSWIRHQALQQISRLTSRSSTETLISAINDSSYDVQSFAIATLNSRSITSAELPSLRRLAQNTSSWIRLQALQQIARIESSSEATRGEITELLIAAFSDSSYDVQTFAIQTMGTRTIGARELNALGNLLNDTNSWVRLQALRQIIRNTSHTATGHVIQCISDSSYDVQSLAANSLANRSFNNANVELLGTMLSNRSSWVRELVIPHMERVGTQRVLDLFLDRVGVESNYNIKQKLVEAIARLHTRLRRPNS